MAFRGLLDTVIAVYRPSQAPDQYGDAGNLGPPLYKAIMSAFLHSTRIYSRDNGPGDEVTGRMYMYAEPKYKLQQGDIIKYVGGKPLSHRAWTLQFAYTPKGKIGEYTVAAYNGTFPDD